MSDESQPLTVVPVHQNLPSDAKNKAISDLTAACYQKASQLQLSGDEIKALSADFPDEAFQPGAAGKENLIYIEHASLRERLDQVIGMGQWCLIPIQRREEPFTYQKEHWQNNRRTGEFDEVKGSHVYVDAILLIRGCFVASAIGEMTYYPDNHTQNYGDAVEGAETAALRRCCKRLGIGLQAWRKDWCLGWWERRKGGRKPTPFAKAKVVEPEDNLSFENASGGSEPLGRVESSAPPKDTTQATKTPTTTVSATPRHRLKALNNLQAAPGQRNLSLMVDYLKSKKWIEGIGSVLDWPLEHVPTSKEAMTELTHDFSNFEFDRREQNDKGRTVTP